MKSRNVRRVSLRRSVFLVSIGTLGAMAFTSLNIACSSSSFKGNKNTQPSPPPESDELDNTGVGVLDKCKDCTAGTTGSADGVVKVNVQSIWFNSDSWYKNCVKLEIGTQVLELGCNKDTARKESFELTLPNAANTKTKNADGKSCVPLNVVVATYKNIGSACIDSGLATCNGPYGVQPNFVKSLKNHSSVFMEQSSATSFPSLAKLNAESQAKITEWFSNEQTSTTNKVVTYFEDRGEEAVAASTTSQSAQTHGVDFNDAIIAIDSGEIVLETGVCK